MEWCGQRTGAGSLLTFELRGGEGNKKTAFSAFFSFPQRQKLLKS